MRFRSRLLSLGSLLLLSASALSAEELARGTPVAREFRTRGGERFLVTITPGPDRGVDPRIFDAIEIGSDEGFASTSNAAALWADRASSHAPKSPTSKAADDAGVVDVSGYHMRIESVSTTAASCNASYVAKLNKVNLNGKKSFFVDGSGIVALLVTAFPTKGDVDTYVYAGDSVTPCDSGENTAGHLDYAACSSSSCTSGSLTAEVYNPFSSQASYVALFRRQFVN
jgi:hypothetical protein